MLTRSRFGVSNPSNDENSNIQAKNFGKSGPAGVFTRSRAVLGDIKNVNTNLPHKLKKPEVCRNIIQLLKDAAKEHKQTVKSLIQQTHVNLNADEIAAYQAFCRQRRDLRTNFLAYKNPEVFMLLDKDAASDTASVSCFAETIFNHLQDKELNFQPMHANFLDACSEITSRMRYILVNWLVQVHQSYKLQPETLYLSVALMDRYIQKSGGGITKDMFQLVGISSLFVASKFEEMYPPDIGDFSSITDNTYNKKDIRSCEHIILESLDFYLSVPSPIVFLRRFSRAIEADHQMHNLAKYFLELTIQEYDLAHLTGNLRATVALCLALAVCAHTSTIDPIWSPKLAFLSGYSIENIRAPLKVLAKAVYRQNSPSKYRAIFEKYRNDDLYDKVAALPQLRSTIMEALADLKFDEDGTEICAQ